MFAFIHTQSHTQNYAKFSSEVGSINLFAGGPFASRNQRLVKDFNYVFSYHPYGFRNIS